MRRQSWKTYLLWSVLAVCLPAGAIGFYRSSSTAEEMTSAANTWKGTLDASQQAQALLSYDDAKRVDWHFIPKESRKGLQVKQMTEAQRKSAHDLLQTALSEAGYAKATKIMSLEKLLHQLEAGKGKNIRDSERYYFTLFGNPTADARWGLSVEGHHLSLNFVIEKGKVISSTPQFFGANPGVVKTANDLGIETGLRVLEKEEDLAFQLVKSLTSEQKPIAIIAEKAPPEIRNAGVAQPPLDAPAGLSAAKMTADQQQLLKALIDEYCAAMPETVSKARKAAIEAAGMGTVQFCWSGATEPGIGHAYRIQGPSFLIEFNNTQPDAAGTPANHVHSIWRDMSGDFGLPIKP